ncbi:MAG: homoserine dehydrogenase [Thermoclostridium sp.]|nr:homoserine dehydrogenase [Thermoclostridium sp.]
MKNEQIHIGIIGLGTVGTGVARVLLQQRELLKTRSGITFNLKAISELNWSRERNIDLTTVKCTTDVNELLDDPEISVIVETIGGYQPAFSFISKALKNGKHVVTANKALIATHGQELFKTAWENGVNLLFEASVGGGIPIIKGLKEGLIANNIESIYGILNGTSNYILTKMYQEGLEFSDALKGAQERGFAEADPTLDVSGGDAAHKLTILASIASNSFVPYESIYMEGITDITKLDIDFAKSFGYTIKLLAIYRVINGGLDLRVHPTLISSKHLLSAVSNELNAIFVSGDFVGNTMFYGPGAGERPTASAIVSDIVDLSERLCNNGDKLRSSMMKPATEVKLIPNDEITNRFYLRFFTRDIPGVLTKISGVLADCGISISSMVQLETHEKENYVPIVLLTHEALEKSMEQALKQILQFEFVKENFLRLRIF